MKVSELKDRKRELGYTNEMIANLSGVPLGTVQKIFGGITSAPRYKTLQKIEEALFSESGKTEETSDYKVIMRRSFETDPISTGEESFLENYNLTESEAELTDYNKYGNEMQFGETRGEYTVEDLNNLPDGLYAELIDGKLYYITPPTLRHQFIRSEIGIQINRAHKRNPDKYKEWLTIFSPVGVELNNDDKTMVLPDVQTICEKKKYTKGDWIHGAPDFIAEVLSPSTAHFDRSSN